MISEHNYHTFRYDITEDFNVCIPNSHGALAEAVAGAEVCASYAQPISGCCCTVKLASTLTSPELSSVASQGHTLARPYRPTLTGEVTQMGLYSCLMLYAGWSFLNWNRQSAWNNLSAGQPACNLWQQNCNKISQIYLQQRAAECIELYYLSATEGSWTVSSYLWHISMGRSAPAQW